MKKLYALIAVLCVSQVFFLSFVRAQQGVPGAGGYLKPVTLKVEWNTSITLEEGWQPLYEHPPIQQTSDGGYVVAGEKFVPTIPVNESIHDVFLAKYNSLGILEWSKIFGEQEPGQGIEEQIKSVKQTKDGGFILAGGTGYKDGDYSWSFLGHTDVYLVKTDSNGNLEWSKTFREGTSLDTEATSVWQTKDGGYVVGGDTNDPSTESDFYLAKTDSNGNLEWSKTFKGPGVDSVAKFVQQTKDGGYVALGTATTPTGNAEEEQLDVMVVKTDSDGGLEWSKTFGGDKSEGLLNGGQQTSDLGYIMPATTDSYGAGGADYYLIRTYENGTLQWSWTFGGSGDDIAEICIQTADGGYIVAGITNAAYVSSFSCCLVKTYEDGKMEWGVDIGYQGQPCLLLDTKDGGFVVGMLENPPEFLPDHYNWHFRIVKYIVKYASGITGNVLEAGLLTIPSAGGYVKAKNVQTGQTYTPSGIEDPSSSWDTNGAYAISCPAGTYQVWAWAPCHISQTKDEISVNEEQNTTGINFRLAPSFARLNFIVVNNEGTPTQGAEVSLTEIPSGFNVSSSTDSQGTTWLELEGTIAPDEADYTLNISQGTQAASTTIHVAIPLCNNITDPGMNVLVQTSQITWDPSAPSASPRIKVTLGIGSTTPSSTLLSTEITLNSDTPSKSYSYRLSAGDKISLNIGVSGDPANLYIYDSTETQMFSQTGINTDPRYEWTVPYDDVFSFVIETTGTESIVAITITSSASPPSTNYLLFIIVAVVVAVGILVALLLIRSRKRSKQLPPPPPPPPSTPTCPTCGGPLRYVQQYQRWYCDKEQKYV